MTTTRCCTLLLLAALASACDCDPTDVRCPRPAQMIEPGGVGSPMIPDGGFGYFALSVAGWSGRQGQVVVPAGTTARLPIRIERFNGHASQIRLEVRADPSPSISTPDPAVTLEAPMAIEQSSEQVELVIKAAPSARTAYHQVLIDAESDEWSSGYGLQLNLEVVAARPAGPDGGGVSTLEGWAPLSIAHAVSGATNHMAFSVLPSSSDSPVIRLTPELRKRGIDGEFPGTEVKQFLPERRQFDLVNDAFGQLPNGSDRVSAPASTFASDGRFYVLRVRAQGSLRLRLDRSEAGQSELSNVANFGPFSSSASFVSDTSLAAGPDGSLHLAWREMTNQGVTYQARRALPFDGGVSLDPSLLVVPTATRFERVIAIAGPALRVVTMQNLTANQARVALFGVGAGGGALFEETVIDDGISVGGGQSMSAVGLPNGDVYVSYRVLASNGRTLTEQLRVKRVARGLVTDLTPETALFGDATVAQTSITATEGGDIFVAIAGGYRGIAQVAQRQGGAWRLLSAGDVSPPWVSQMVLQYATFGNRKVLFRALRIDDFYSNADDHVLVQTWSLQ